MKLEERKVAGEQRDHLGKMEDGRRHSGVKRPGRPEEGGKGAVAEQHVLMTWERRSSLQTGNGGQGNWA